MSSYGGDNLFGTGPHRFKAGGLALRHVLRESPGSRGVQIAAQGVQGRSIEQKGELLADDPAMLTELTQAIEGKLDGRTGVLVDDLDRSWTDVVMLSFEPGEPRRIGTRWGLAYRIMYLQVKV